MSLIENLTTNYRAATVAISYKAPQNLTELCSLLRNVCLAGMVHPDLPFYCNWYSEFLTKIYNDENQSMIKTRGKARRMWAEQSLIYQDLIALLKDLSGQILECSNEHLREVSDTLSDLVDELREAVEEMQAWTVNEEARCLGCGWNGSTGHCPHCNLQVLKPVRRYATQVNSYVALAPLQGQVFQAIVGVLEGERDVTVLRLPLQQLEASCSEALQQMQACHQLEIAQTALVNISQALAGLAQINRIFQDGDAQHLEDGWSMIFEADRANLAAAQNVNSVAVAVAYDIIRDQVCLTNE